MKRKYLLLTIILFMCLFLFSTISFALIPGDFGSAGGGPPDGVVDFEDLMIFAMAYGSTPADANWNPLCDIAGQGSTTPDGVIDFEDLMIFAMHYGRSDVVTDVDAITLTYQSSMSKLKDKITTQLEEKGELPSIYHFNELTEPKKGVTGYAIHVGWHGYPDATGYRVYRSVNGGDYSIVLDEEISGYTWYGRWDNDVSPGSTYSYYVTAYGSDWETDPSEIITRDTWLPPCSLISPTDESFITDPNPTFTWNPVGLTSADFPYGSIVSGESDLWIYDETAYESPWWIFFDMTNSSATYNQDGQATPLVSGHAYYWESWGYGNDDSGHLIAISYSESWGFYYGNIVADVYADAVTYQSTSMEMFQVNMDKLIEEELIPDSFHLNELPPFTKGVTEHVIDVGWHSYPDATGYKVYRSVNGGSFSLIFQDEPTTSYTYYGFWDYDVSEGNSYTYYVTSYGSGWETDPSQTVTIDTWLPPCSLISPTDQSIITDPTPLFTWNPVGLAPADFPYGSIVSGHSDLDVWNESVWEHAWWLYFDDLTTASAVYNEDNTGDSLQISQGYSWNIDSYGYDTNNNLIAYSWSESWNFVYSGGANAGVTEVEAEAETYVSESMMMQYLTEIQTDWPGEGYIFNEPERAKAEVNHDIWIMWKAFCETSGCGFKVYRSINGGSFELIFLNGAPPTGYEWYYWVDNEAGPGNTYFYYVTAYGSGWETAPSQTVTIDTWLPPCSLISPTDGSLISNPNPIFDWDPGITDFPYGSLVSGDTCMLVYDDTTSSFTWIICTGDPNISTVTYNQDGGTLPLVNGHNYTWHCWTSGYDENGYRIAVSESIDWHFDYTGP